VVLLCVRLPVALLVVLPQGLPCVEKAAVFLKGCCAAERKGCELPAGGFPEGSWQPFRIYLDDKVLPGPGGGCAPGGGIALTTLFDVCKVLVFGILRFGGAAVFSRASKL